MHQYFILMRVILPAFAIARISFLTVSDVANCRRANRGAQITNGKEHFEESFDLVKSL